MKKPVKVHRLPTEKINAPNYKKLGICDGLLYQNGYRQHLYFTSDEEIKESEFDTYGKRFKDGDWILYNSFEGKQIFQKTKYNICRGNFKSELCRKIVATTDKSLFVWGQCEDCKIIGNHVGCNLCKKVNLSQISQQFQEEYAKAGGIDEVLLEYSDYEVFDRVNPRWRDLILDSNNCVIIHPVEPKLYTLEEMKLSFKAGKVYEQTCTDKFGYNEKYSFGNWIKENLK
jgi:hypothetical protein